MKSRIYFALALAVTVFIFANSALNGDTSAQISSGLFAFLMEILSRTGITLSHFLIRKAAHFTEFFAQSAFLSLSAKNSKRGFKPYALAIAFSGLLTACCDEFIQQFSVGRSSQVSDVFIDFGGTLTALLVIVIYNQICKRRCNNVRF